MKLRFSIRDIMWLTLVVALVVGWWIDHAKIVNSWEYMFDRAKEQPLVRGGSPYNHSLPGNSHDYTCRIAREDFGFADWNDGTSAIFIGPFGRHKVPFTATQGLIGCGVILATLIILPVVLTMRWKKKRATL